MSGWFTRKKTLLQIVADVSIDYVKMTDLKDAQIINLDRKLREAREARTAHIKDLKAQLHKARDETEFVIGAFSSEIHKIKTELHQLRIEDDIRGIEADVVRSQARAFYILGHTKEIPWIELENQVRLLENLMAARQEYQQT